MRLSPFGKLDREYEYELWEGQMARKIGVLITGTVLLMSSWDQQTTQLGKQAKNKLKTTKEQKVDTSVSHL